MTNMSFSSEHDFVDIQSVNHWHEAVDVLAEPADRVLAALRARSRDNARSPMQWDASGGFSTVRPWSRANPNTATINVAAQRDDPDSVLSHYRRLIALRRTEPLVTDGRFELLLADDPRLFAFTRSGASGTLVVVANWSGSNTAVPASVFAEWADAPAILPTLRDAPGTLGVLEVLRPWEAIVFRAGRS